MKFSNYPDLASHLFNEAGLKIQTVYVNNFDYSKYAIYLPRIYSCDHNKAKIRVINPDVDKVKNCLKITFNPDKIDKQYLIYLIESKKHLFKYWLRGSCQTFLTQSAVKQILMTQDRNNKPTQQAVNLLNVEL